MRLHGVQQISWGGSHRPAHRSLSGRALGVIGLPNKAWSRSLHFRSETRDAPPHALLFTAEDHEKTRTAPQRGRDGLKGSVTEAPDLAKA